MKQVLYILTSLVSIIFFISCDDDETCSEPTFEYTWTENQSIDMVVDTFALVDTLMPVSNYFTTSGQYNLFVFRNRLSFCEDIADTGGSVLLSFVVPPDSTESFLYSGQELKETSAFLNISTFGGGPHHSIEEGEISGTRVNENSWQVSIDVTTQPQDSRVQSPADFLIDEIFTLE